MAGITEIRSRMRSIEQTLKITNAMYLISSSKVKKPVSSFLRCSPIFEQIAKTLLDIFRHSRNCATGLWTAMKASKKKGRLCGHYGRQRLAGRLQPQCAEAGRRAIWPKKDPTLS